MKREEEKRQRRIATAQRPTHGEKGWYGKPSLLPPPIIPIPKQACSKKRKTYLHKLGWRVMLHSFSLHASEVPTHGHMHQTPM